MSDSVRVCTVVVPQVEAALGVEGDDILYVGDHIYTDAALAKINFRWGGYREGGAASAVIRCADPVVRRPC
jgi:hypothetical protein